VKRRVEQQNKIKQWRKFIFSFIALDTCNANGRLSVYFGIARESTTNRNVQLCATSTADYKYYGNTDIIIVFLPFNTNKSDTEQQLLDDIRLQAR